MNSNGETPSGVATATKACNGEASAATAATTLKKPPPPPSMSADSTMNLSLMDPPRWGWAAVGGIVDLLPPHEVRFSFYCFLTLRKSLFPSLGTNF